MSEKRAKRERKEKAGQPKLIYDMRIRAFDNDTVRVTDFPLELNMAMKLFNDGQLVVIKHFMNLMAEGKIARANKSNIVVPQPSIFVPGL